MQEYVECYGQFCASDKMLNERDPLRNLNDSFFLACAGAIEFQCRVDGDSGATISKALLAAQSGTDHLS